MQHAVQCGLAALTGGESSSPSSAGDGREAGVARMKWEKKEHAGMLISYSWRLDKIVIMK